MQPTNPSDAASPHSPVRLLVVDDDEGIRALLEVTATLDPRYELAGIAGSASEALAAVSADDGAAIDVVLLDVTLPDRDGISVVGDLRDVRPAMRVVLFTGWSDEDTKRRAQAAGADAVFGKDGDPQRLLDDIFSLAAGG